MLLHSRRLGLLGLLILVSLPWWIWNGYYMHLANSVLIHVILVLGLNLIMGYTGQLSFGHAGFLAIGAYTSAILSVKLGLSFWIACPLAGVAAALLGYLLGTTTARVRGHYLALVTLGFSIIVLVIIRNWDNLTGGANGMSGIPAPRIGSWTFDTNDRFYFIALAVTALVVWACALIVNSRVGRAMRAIRENEVGAMSVGISVFRYKLVAFVAGSFFAGLAGSLYAHNVSFISPETFSMELSILLVVMLVTGGVGSIPGSIAGATLLTLIPEWLRALSDYQMIVWGLFIIIVVIFMPEGMAGLFNRVSQRFGWNPKTVKRTEA